MNKLCATIVILTALIYVNAQVHYVPAQILIPTFNGSAFYNNHTNNSLPNNVTGIWNRNTSDGNLNIGRIGYLDRLLFNQLYLKTSSWFYGREKIVEYPKDVPGGYVRSETISAIRAHNYYYDGHKSNISLIDGGVGRKFAKIKITSKRNYGFKVLVQVFGH